MDHFGFAAAFSVEGFVELLAQGADVFGGAAEDVAVAGGVGSYEDAGDAGAAFGEEVDEFAGCDGVHILFEKCGVFRTVGDGGGFLVDEGFFQLQDLADEVVVFLF